MAKVFYVRVSTLEQNTERQEEAARSIGVDRIYVEKASGKNAERPQLKAMLEYLRDGDVLYVESISRLARSVRDLLNIIDEIEQKGVGFVSLKENIDTSTPQGVFILQIFGALAELEREQTRQRQREGIEIAKSKGIYKGRQLKKVDEALFHKLYYDWQSKKITAVKFGDVIGLKPNAFYRRLRRYESTGKVN